MKTTVDVKVRDDIPACVTVIEIRTDPIVISVSIPDYEFVDEGMAYLMRKKMDQVFKVVAKQVVSEMYESFLKGVDKHV